MRRALVRKLGWSSTIRTVFPMDVILAHGCVQIYTAGRTPGWQSEPRPAPARTSWMPAIPPGYGASPLGVWRHARNQPRGGSTMSADRIATRALAARAGRWSAQHRRKAIWGWPAFALVAFMIGGALGTKTQTNAQSGVGESGRAARTLDGAFPKHQVEQVLIQSKPTTASDRSFRAVVGDVQRRLSAVPYTNALESPYKAAHAGQISAE